MDKLDYIVNLIRNSNKTTVLTGAGMSTASGIPDFKTLKKENFYGLSTERILSKQFFFEYPDLLYEFIEKYLYNINVSTNEGHNILAKWENRGLIDYIITQNIDGLHFKAGNKNVIEYHGTMSFAQCTNEKCKKKYFLDQVLQRKNNKDDFWICDCLDGFIKPDIVLYGDTGIWMVGDRAHFVYGEVYDADVILVLGTGLGVYPFANLVKYKNPSSRIVIINKGETTYDDKVDVIKVNEDIVETLNYLNKSI